VIIACPKRETPWFIKKLTGTDADRPEFTQTHSAMQSFHRNHYVQIPRKSLEFSIASRATRGQSLGNVHFSLTINFPALCQFFFCDEMCDAVE